MAQDNKKDLTPDELLKKLLTSFGEEELESETDQLTIEEAAKEEQKAPRPKIFRFKKEEGTVPTFYGEEESSAQDPDRKELEERIKQAEQFVEDMEKKTEQEKEESPFRFAFEIEESEESGVCEKDDPIFSISNDKEEKCAEKSSLEQELSEEFKAEQFSFADEEAELSENSEEEFEEAFENSEELEEDVFALYDEQEEGLFEESPAFSEAEEQSLEALEQSEGEEQADSPEVDETELDMMMLFGEKKKLEETVGKEEARRRRLSMEGDAGAESIKEEYESADQNARFFKMLRRAYTAINIRTFLAFLAFVAVFLLELVLPEIVASGKSIESMFGPVVSEILLNPVMTALCGLQVTMLLAGVAYKEVFDGIKAFATGRSVPQMLLSVTVIFTLIYEIALLFCHSASAPFYNLPVALAVLLAVFFSKMNLSRTILSFKIISSKRNKFVITHRSESTASLEKEAFGQYLSEKAGVFGVGKTEFVSNFAKRSAREPRYKGAAVVLSSVAAVVGVVFFILGYYFAEENAFLSGLVLAIQSVLLCIPASAFVVYALPFYKASQKAFRLDSAIVGEFSLEEYADATVISFDDKEVFPARNVKVHSLKLFGDTRIDHVLFGASSVFHRIGGPLEDVFDVATKESGYTDKVDLLEAAPGGIEAAVDGELVRIGNARFMRSKGLLSAVDPDDTALEMEGRIMVMYLSIGEKLAAKMYITYSADKEIEDIMSSLYKAGMCIGIRTLDPNIDDRMISSHVDLSKYPVKVLRTDKAESAVHEERTESGIVSKRNVRSLLKTLTFCRRVLQVIRTGTVIKVLSMIAGVGVAALILYMSISGKITGVYDIQSLWILLYQLCWLVPVTLISLIFV